jgi:uncharacterized membrane protein YqjE
MTSEVHGPTIRLVDALRVSAALLVDVVHTRLALFSHEIEVELERMRASAFLLFGAMVCLALSITLMVFFAIAVFWDTHRLAAIGICGSALLLASFGLMIRLRSRLSASPPPFYATLRELREDIGMLRRVDVE